MSDYPHVYAPNAWSMNVCRCGHQRVNGPPGDCPAAMRDEIASLRGQLSEAKATANAILERITTADAPWRLPGCECEVDSKPADRCNVRWTRCSARLHYLRAAKAAERA